LIKLARLERGLKGLFQELVLELLDLKVYSYSHFKITLLKSRKGDVRKFDGKDLVNWILHVERYFDLHGVPLLKKLYIAYSYLESDQFLWYKGLCSHKHLAMWLIFTA